MAEISVRGKNEKISKKEMKYIVSFFSHVLLGTRLSKNVYVEVINEPMESFYCGFCCPLEDKRSPRDFEITLNSNMARKTMLHTIAHEMVHVMQFARNEFRILDKEDHYKWKGKVRRVPRTNYFKMPWEKQAHSGEQVLVEIYQKHLKDNKLTFK